MSSMRQATPTRLRNLAYTSARRSLKKFLLTSPSGKLRSIIPGKFISSVTNLPKGSKQQLVSSIAQKPYRQSVYRCHRASITVFTTHSRHYRRSWYKEQQIFKLSNVVKHSC